MDDAKISGKVVYDDIWVGITTSADDEKVQFLMSL